MQDDLAAKSEAIRRKKEHQALKAMEIEMQQEAKKKELVKRQVERRKREEAERARRARDMLLENRQRVALRSELLARGQRIDPQARQDLAFAYMR